MEELIRRLDVEGKEIVLVPTAHISRESVELVREVIEREQPDSVCIELDAKRFETLENPRAWEDTNIITVIKNHQVGFMIANLALSSYQKRLADKLGTKVGGEMLQAIESARECGAEIVLADREIQTTFLRIWRKLGLWSRAKLLAGIIVPDDSSEQIDEDALAELLKNDILESLVSEVDSEFPQIGDVLIHERDQYLSDKIKHAPGNKVVAVLGGAHVPGVSKEIYHSVDVDALAALPPKKPIGKIIGWAIPIVIIALIAYGFVLNAETGLQQLGTWVLWTSGLAGIFTLLALGHPLAILTSLVLAPFTTLNPALAVGWFTGIVQATVDKPQVKDIHAVQEDVFTLKGFFRNKVLKVFVVIVFANIGASIGTFVAGADIITNLLA